jgi:hypothetical protein
LIGQFINRFSGKKDCSNMPIGRVKERKPLGHSGQRKLHEVVGSNEMENGITQVESAILKIFCKIK